MFLSLKCNNCFHPTEILLNYCTWVNGELLMNITLIISGRVLKHPFSLINLSSKMKREKDTIKTDVNVNMKQKKVLSRLSLLL